MSKIKALVVVCVLLAAVGVACLIAGIVVITKSNSRSAEKNVATDDKCAYSDEAKRHNLPEFFQKVQDTYYDLNPHLISHKPGIKLSEMFEKFRPYDPSPERLKTITDKSLELYKELTNKRIDKHKLKPRERKGLAQMRHYLQTIFGTPYDGNYYTGDYLLGPSMFCVRSICSAYSRADTMLTWIFEPSTVKDIETFLHKIKAVNHTFIQYKANLDYGAKSGMVRSTDSCKVGVDSFIASLGIPTDKLNPQGIS